MNGYKIISKTLCNGDARVVVPPELPKHHKLAFKVALKKLQQEPTFEMFGGIIKIQSANYQVVPSNESS